MIWKINILPEKRAFPVVHENTMLPIVKVDDLGRVYEFWIYENSDDQKDVTVYPMHTIYQRKSEVYDE